MRRFKRKPAAPGRQRPSQRAAAPANYAYRSQRAERQEANGRQQSSLATQRSRLLSARYWLRRSGLLIAIVAGAVCLVALLRVAADPRIILIDAGNTYALQAPDAYRLAASQQLGSSIWNRNKLTVDTTAAANDLRRQFPELAKVTITLPLVGQRPIYYLEASSPSFVLQTLSGSFVLDSHGKVLLTKAAAPEAVIADLPVLVDQSGTAVAVGKQALSTTQLQFIQTIVAGLVAKQVAVASLVLPAGSVQQLDVRVQDKPYTIKFDMHDSGGARTQLGTYLAIADELAKQGITPSQYVDVRITGRAYYQ